MAVKYRVVQHYVVHQKSKTYRVEDCKLYPTKYSLEDSTGTVWELWSQGMLRKGSVKLLGVIIDDIFCPLFLSDQMGDRVTQLGLKFDLRTLFKAELDKLVTWNNETALKGDL